MCTQRLGNLVFVTCMFIACGYFAYIAEGFVTSGLLATSGLPSKFFPQLTLMLTGACAVMVGVIYVRIHEAGGDANEMVFSDRGEAWRGLSMLVVAIICYSTWNWFGFLPMAVILGPLSLIAMSERRIAIYAIVWALTAAVWVIFTYGLKIQLL
jgi:hypothetical protein